MSEIKSGLPIHIEQPKPKTEIAQQTGLFEGAGKWEELPHEVLVGIVRDYVAEGKRKWVERNGEAPFDPAMWLGEKLSKKTLFHGDDPSRVQTSHVWDAITAPYHKDKSYQRDLHGILRDGSVTHGRFITIDEKGQKLMKAMLDAIDVPHAKDLTNVDLLQHVPKELWPRDAQQSRRLLTHVKRFIPWKEPEEGDKKPPSILSILADFFRGFQEDPPKKD